MIKVLNLYAGIGGNRKLWKDVEVTAVENNPEIAAIYQDFFPDDKVIVTDAHQYLLDHYKEFDFIWSSPPCPTHSRMNFLTNEQEGKTIKYPDMKLWQEILLLKYWFTGRWVVENVIIYYGEMFSEKLKPYYSENHFFWSNFYITNRNPIKRNITTEVHEHKWGFDLRKLNLSKKKREQILNNLVNPYLGRHVFNCVFKTKQMVLQ